MARIASSRGLRTPWAVYIGHKRPASNSPIWPNIFKYFFSFDFPCLSAVGTKLSCKETRSRMEYQVSLPWVRLSIPPSKYGATRRKRMQVQTCKMSIINVSRKTRFCQSFKTYWSKCYPSKHAARYNEIVISLLILCHFGN